MFCFLPIMLRNLLSLTFHFLCLITFRFWCFLVPAFAFLVLVFHTVTGIVSGNHATIHRSCYIFRYLGFRFSFFGTFSFRNLLYRSFLNPFIFLSSSIPCACVIKGYVCPLFPLKFSFLFKDLIGFRFSFRLS